MIVVTGASGQLGHAVVEGLARLVPPASIVASMRDPAKGSDLAALGVEVRRGDFEDADSLKRAFAGAAQILIVSSNARATGGDPLKHHRTAIEAARHIGARRVVYTSQMAASPASAFPPARDHAATEAMLAESGMAWTALRHGFYASGGIRFIGGAFKTGRIDAPADGRTAWTAHADLADGAAAVLANEGSFYGPTPPLTGSEALDMAELAAIASAAGHPVERNVLSDEAFTRMFVERGLPEAAARMMLGYYTASRNGEFSRTDATLERLIGRRPKTMPQVIAEHISIAVAAESPLPVPRSHGA